MKKLFPLMFALAFANQVFAVESEVVATEVAPVEEVIRSVVLDETAKTIEEAKVIYDELKTRGLTDAQIVATVEESLRNETTENAYRSILDKHNQGKIVWALVGAVVTCGVIYGVIPGGQWAYGKYFKPVATPAGESGTELNDLSKSGAPADSKSADDKSADESVK